MPEYLKIKRKWRPQTFNCSYIWLSTNKLKTSSTDVQCISESVLDFVFVFHFCIVMCISICSYIYIRYESGEDLLLYKRFSVWETCSNSSLISVCMFVCTIHACVFEFVCTCICIFICICIRYESEVCLLLYYRRHSVWGFRTNFSLISSLLSCNLVSLPLLTHTAPVLPNVSQAQTSLATKCKL